MTDTLDRAFAAFQAELLARPGSTRDALAAAIAAAVGERDEAMQCAAAEARMVDTIADERDKLAAVLGCARRTIQRWCDDQDFMPDEDAELLSAIDVLLGPAERVFTMRWPHGSMGEEA